jgi:hypothetical protein
MPSARQPEPAPGAVVAVASAGLLTENLNRQLIALLRREASIPMNKLGCPPHKPRLCLLTLVASRERAEVALARLCQWDTIVQGVQDPIGRRNRAGSHKQGVDVDCKAPSGEIGRGEPFDRIRCGGLARPLLRPRTTGIGLLVSVRLRVGVVKVLVSRDRLR